jgi:hypothetical protein
MWLSGEGDGVVSLASAQLDNASSQIVVPADHMSVHRHPQSILEVRRILMQHIAELQGGHDGGNVNYASTMPLTSLSPHVPAPMAARPMATAH